MRRVVLDSNVVISALLFGSPPAALVRLIREGLVLSATSSVLLAELEGVLVLKFQYPTDVAELVVAEWRALSEHVEPGSELTVIAQDPSDNRVLECAVSARADAIVSGDKHLLALKAFRGIPILSPHQFLSRDAGRSD